MKIRRYLGKDSQEAMLKVKMDLGNEAVIVSQRKVRQKGFLGYFAKQLTEIVATLDESENKKEKHEKSKKLEEEIKEKDQKLNQLENKVNNMEEMIQKIYNQMTTGVGSFVKNDEKATNDKILELFQNNLLKNEVDTELVNKIIQIVKEKVLIPNVHEVANTLFSTIKTFLGKPEPINFEHEKKKPHVIIFLGPTGVGKTTTIAKIAADYSLNHKKKIGFITADTYRIAAIEQLKTYAEILGMPVNVVYSPAEINEAINKFSDYDMILIDTAGRSHKNKAHFEELKQLVKNVNADETYLLISATTGMRDCKDIINNYSFIENHKLIFTKLDETTSYGFILNTRSMSGRPVSYATIGQSVPDDIEILDIDKIAKILLGSING